MNAREEEIDRTEKISYRKIVYQQTLYIQSNCKNAYYKTSGQAITIFQAPRRYSHEAEQRGTWRFRDEGLWRHMAELITRESKFME